MPKEWFKDWFDTAYYHLLYDERDEHEARHFMGHLTDFLSLKRGDSILDLPCGKGRHSVYLNSLGYAVTGADISENSLQHARKFENSKLRFIRQDMRHELADTYDAIFNLFTSFGYFEDDQSNIEVLKHFKKGLGEKGILVIDFLNADYTRKTMVPNEVILKGGIEFHIEKRINRQFIEKHIRFSGDGQSHHYVERLRNLSLKDFKNYFDEAGLKISHIFGEYNLSDYEPHTSSRLILVAQ
ncbi:MAG: methyltransferase domain-containing protein [Flavobacteriaceae bacterium]|nr:methyltransferase domain-containing protein [Flavobacteriaceae bacterium]